MIIGFKSDTSGRFLRRSKKIGSRHSHPVGKVPSRAASDTNTPKTSLPLVSDITSIIIKRGGSQKRCTAKMTFYGPPRGRLRTTRHNHPVGPSNSPLQDDYRLGRGRPATKNVIRDPSGHPSDPPFGPPKHPKFRPWEAKRPKMPFRTPLTDPKNATFCHFFTYPGYVGNSPKP
jgi:hypothetical protein